MTTNVANQAKGWRSAKIQDIGIIYSGTTPSTSNESFWDGFIVWVTPDDLSKLQTRYLYSSERRITALGLKKSSRYLLPSKSLVISTRAPIGYMAIPTVDFCTNQGCKTIVFQSNQDVEFHYYNLLFRVNRLKEKGKGTTFAEISKTDIGRIIIPFPVDKEEQSKIAEVLATCDEAIEKTDTKIEKLKCIKQGLMQDLFRYGIDENGQIRSEKTHKFKDSPLGMIPWDIMTISLAGQIITGTTPSTKQSEYYDGPYMFVSPTDICDRVYINGTEKTISEQGLKVSRSIPKNSICVVCIGSTIGKVGIPTSICATNQQINTIIPNNDNYYLIIYYLCIFYLLKQLRMEAGLQAVPIVNKGVFSRLLIPKISVEEQSRITSVLSRSDEAIEKEEIFRNKLLSIKCGLMDDLLSGKVRVNKLMKEAV